MKNRNRAYYRHQRRRAIKRKLFIYCHIWGWKNVPFPPGRYAKGKVHCSCRLCKYEKHYKIIKPKYKSKLEQMKREINEWMKKGSHK
jgi:hypothetical protein